MAAQQAPLGPLVLVAFLLLATFTQVLLAFYGLLSRYLQVVSTPSIPALRLVVVNNLLAEAALLLFHTAPAWLTAWVRQRRAQARGLPTHNAMIETPADGRKPQLEDNPGCSELGSDKSSTADPLAAAPPTAVSTAAAISSEGAGGTGQPVRLQPANSTLRPPVPLLRGLSRRMEDWEQRRPVLHRRLALAAITAAFTGVCSLQILAPGFVDVSIVMLTTQWTTLGIALAQALLLGHRLPLPFWPWACVMLAGAAMVIVPAIGQSTSGSLSTRRGWAGFAMAIGALLCTVIYYCLLQATRHMKFTALQLQHLMNLTGSVFFLILTLPIDGTSWGAQFGGWGAADWVVLMALSTAAYLGSCMLMQVCVWRLGAPTAAMFFGLRLVFSVALSTPVLGSTVIKSGLQIAGVVVTAVAVTAYAGSQWWSSRRAAAASAAPTAPAPVPAPAAKAAST